MEFSLVVVLFVALLYGLIAFGMAFALKQSMTGAVAEAARAAVGAAEGQEADEAYAEAEDRLDWLGSDRCCERVGDPASLPKHMDITVTDGIVCGSAQCIEVKASYDYESSPLVPILRLPGFSFLFPDEINTEATVRLPSLPSNP